MSVDVLYKYGRLGEHAESVFSTNNIWFASPSSLNDPFECRPWFEFEGTDEQVVNFLVRVLKKRKATLSDVDAIEQALKMIKDGRHRDPRFWAFFRRDVAKLFASDIGLCCLSTTNTNILMWSHYAMDHQGYCLEFEATDTTPFFGEAQKVSYSKEFPVVNFFNTPRDEQVDLIFLTKFEGWKYEEEYRVVDHQAGAGLRSYPMELLKSVTFGMRMSQKDKERIRRWLEARGSGVELYEAAVHEREFKIIASGAQ